MVALHESYFVALDIDFLNIDFYLLHYLVSRPVTPCSSSRLIRNSSRTRTHAREQAAPQQVPLVRLPMRSTPIGVAGDVLVGSPSHLMRKLKLE